MFKTNEYFDGKVKSIAFQTETLPATIGVMAPGEYVFNTADQEQVTVISGALTIRLADGKTGQFCAGRSFKVPENSSFDVSVEVESS
ncbi:MAG TPA: pyrimidine/purine nucleoside phosphorylase [Gammaproteobacteria bacterium]|nr:pyrimidine/purine nucleoside phosphorylase [Gammaproteobacteria bacterium]